MAIQPNDVIRVRANLSGGGVSLLQNVFHVQHQGLDAVPDFDVRDAIGVWLDTAYQAIEAALNQEVLFTDIESYNLTADDPLLSIAWPTLVNGGGITEPLPYNATVLVSFQTYTKNSVGRKYVSGLDEAWGKNGGVLEAGVVPSFELWGDRLLAGFTVDGNVFQAGNYRSATATFITWANREVRDIMATQRRRRIGIGA